jgi:DNA mismatch repair protein MSH4
MTTPRPSTSYSYASTSRTSYQNGSTNSASLPTYGRRPSTSGPSITRPSTACPSTGRRSRAGSIIGGGESQQIICAINEARGISPTVGLAFVNISTGEAVLSQICDSQFYVRTLNKLQIFDPTEILIISTAGPPNPKSKMYQVIEENIPGARIITIDRKYWSEPAGLEYIDQFAFSEDVQAIKVAIGGNYFATCCFAAVCSVWTFSYYFKSYLILLFSGSQIYRPRYVLDLRISLSPYQVPAIRGHDDDRPFHNPVFGTDPEYTELEV